MTMSFGKTLALSSVLLVAQLFTALPAVAETVEELQAALEAREAELAAQRQLNALQRQRIETLEAELAGRRIVPALASRQSPERAADDPEGERALERALVRRGTAVLSPYIVEVTPSLGWGHSGSDFNSTTDNSYVAALDARIGLPGGWMIGGSIPYVHRDIAGRGDNTGLGDVSATVWKSLIAPNDEWPSLVGSLRYGAPTGDDFAEDAVALGSGYHRLTGRLSASRSIDPIAVFGDVSYTHFISETISGIDVDRSGVFGVGAGVSLAVTPDITVSTGIDFSFEDEVKVNGRTVRGSATTIGQLEFGAGIVLTRDVFLTFNGAAGITDDSPDVSLGMSLPMRF